MSSRVRGHVELVDFAAEPREFVLQLELLVGQDTSDTDHFETVWCVFKCLRGLG